MITFEETILNGKVELKAKHNEVSKHTRQYIISHLKRYFEWIEGAKHIPEELKANEHFFLDKHVVFPETVMNYYLNDYGVGTLGWGHENAKQAQLTLTYYYNWLSYNFPEHSRYRRITLNELSTKKNDKTKKVPKYLSKDLRRNLCEATDNPAYKLAIRCGSELGLRTAEFGHVNKIAPINPYHLEELTGHC